MNKEKFKALFDTYFDAVRSYIYYRCGDNELATDIAQDTFLRVWEKDFNFDDKYIKALLYKIAGDMFISAYRKTKTALQYQQVVKFQFREEVDVDDLGYKELQEAYEKALNELPEKQRTVFLMSRMENLTNREIAERLDISIKAVEKRMTKALQYFRTKLNVTTNG